MTGKGVSVTLRGRRSAFGLGRSLLSGAMSKIAERGVRLATELTGEDFDARIAGIESHATEAGFDPFGFDPATGKNVLALSAVLHRKYFRTEVEGIERVPPGPVMLVANHSGQLPIDGVLIATALMLDAKPSRFARTMVEKWTAQLPFVSSIFPKVGQVVGTPENARRLLERGECVIVFPEGVKGVAKTIDKRYQLQEFGFGFMRIAIQTGAPIVPVSVIGGEEQYVSVADLKPLAKLLGVPAFPVVPQMLFGMVAPLPTKYRIRFGDPVVFDGDPDAPDDVIADDVDIVRNQIDAMLQQGLAARKGIFA